MHINMAELIGRRKLSKEWEFAFHQSLESAKIDKIRAASVRMGITPGRPLD